MDSFQTFMADKENNYKEQGLHLHKKETMPAKGKGTSMDQNMEKNKQQKRKGRH